VKDIPAVYAPSPKSWTLRWCELFTPQYSNANHSECDFRSISL